MSIKVQLLNCLAQVLLGRKELSYKYFRPTLVSSGKLNPLVKRIFFKKNGEIRPSLTPEIRAIIEREQTIIIKKNERLALSKWLETHDTPTDDWLNWIEKTTNSQPSVLVLLPIGEDSHEQLLRVNSIIQSIGITFEVLPTECDCTETRDKVCQALVSSGISILSDNHVDQKRFSYVVYVGKGAVLRPHGMRLLLEEIKRTNAVVAYSDTVLLKNGEIESSWFKPDYSPVLSNSLSLFDSFCLVDIAASGIQNITDIDWRDLESKFASNQVTHSPHVCYFLNDSYRARVSSDCASPQFCPPDQLGYPKVAIIIPTRNNWALLGPCLDSIKVSDWPNDALEVIVVDNGSDEKIACLELSKRAELGEITLLRDDSFFNYSRLNNTAVAETDAEILVFLNNDTVIQDSNWLKKLVYYSIQPKVGAVGAKLLYPDGTVQHAGVVVGINGGAGHGFVGIERNSEGYNGLALCDREVSAVTGACLAVRREAFLKVGGFDENLRVAYSDITLCSSLQEAGMTNILVADALLTHHESKSRGYDDTISKQVLSRKEAIYARSRHNSQWSADPYYSKNLSLEAPYKIADLPRRHALWSKTEQSYGLHILVLSSVHQRGYGVPVVIDRHVHALLAEGFRVSVGGPITSSDFDYDGAERVDLSNARDASNWAFQNDVSLIWAHTPPFFSCSRWVAGQIPIFAYDYGEPPARYFPDWLSREMVNLEKAFSLSMCDRVFAISEAVREEAVVATDGVIPLGNNHLSTWSNEMQSRRMATREKYGWGDIKIVLNVCRFLTGERHYKGIDTYLEFMRQYQLNTSQLDGQVLFVLCGRGEKQDVEELRGAGLEVFANLSDEELENIYSAADAYVNFSRWEGYNLGIAQALALGLDVVASDNPAHRAFGIKTFSDLNAASASLDEILAEPKKRKAQLWPWLDSERLAVKETLRGCLSNESD